MDPPPFVQTLGQTVTTETVRHQQLVAVVLVVPPGVAIWVWDAGGFGETVDVHASSGGAAQWKPFCNKPPVKQQVYYE